MSIFYDNAVNTERSVVNVKSYGATGNGVTNDASSVNSAIAYAEANNLPVYFPPGTYNLSGISTSTYSNNVRIIGDNRSLVTISGDAAKSFIKFNPGASCFVQGVKFVNWLNVCHLNANSGSLDYGLVGFKECEFEKIVISPLYCQNGVDHISEVRFQDNKCLNAGYINNADRCGGISIAASGVLSAFITNNEINTVGGASVVGPRYGIYIGGITDDYRTSVVIENNRIFNVRNSGLEDCDGIICYGRHARIVNNAINTVLSSNVSNIDQEGIYIKSDYSVVMGNNLVNAGGREGCIVIKGGSKGVAVTTDSHGNDSIISNNTILIDDGRTIRSIGIYSQQEGVMIHDNNIEGVTWGISVDTTCKNVTISNNKLINLTNQPSDAVYGIILTNPQEVIVDGNLLNNVGSGTQSIAFGIYVLNSSGNSSGPLKITNNSVNDLNSSSASNARSIYINPAAGSTVSYLSIDKNRINDTGRGIYLNTGNVITHLRVTENDVSNASTSNITLNSATSGTVYGNTINNSQIFNATANDATPSVAGINILRVNNSINTTITDFDDGLESQELRVLINDTKTTVQSSGTLIRLDGGLNFTPVSGGTLYLLNDGGIWKEYGRANF